MQLKMIGFLQMTMPREFGNEDDEILLKIGKSVGFWFMIL